MHDPYSETIDKSTRGVIQGGKSLLVTLGNTREEMRKLPFVGLRGANGPISPCEVRAPSRREPCCCTVLHLHTIH